MRNSLEAPNKISEIPNSTPKYNKNLEEIDFNEKSTNSKNIKVRKNLDARNIVKNSEIDAVEKSTNIEVKKTLQDANEGSTNFKDIKATKNLKAPNKFVKRPIVSHSLKPLPKYDKISDINARNESTVKNISEIDTNDDSTEDIRAEKNLNTQNKVKITHYSKTSDIITSPSKISIKKRSSRPTFCGHCKCSFASEEILKQHKETVHTCVNRVYICEYCSKKFKSSSKRRDHMRIHTGEQPFECDHCLQRFSFRTNLQRHKKIHTGEKRHVCDHCGKRFIQLVSLQGHLLVHSKGRYLCEICGKLFSQKFFVRKHLLLTHKIDSYDKDNVPTRNKISSYNKNKEIFQCDKCSYKGISKQALRRHRVTHGPKKFLCDDCGKLLKSRITLKIHQQTHTGEKPHCCEFCSRRFAQLTSLWLHRRTHTGWY